jgi:hypothetical protein
MKSPMLFLKYCKEVLSLAAFLFGLLCDPEDGSSLFLQNVKRFLNYILLELGKPYSSWSPL